MRRRRNSKFILFLGLILLISVGYALISTTLNINGIAGFKSNTWKVVWDSDSVEVSSGSVSSVDPVVNSSKDTVSYTADLTLPGDFYEFTIDAVNEGTIDAVLSVNALLPVVYNEDGEEIELPEGLIYKVKYADGGEVKKNHLIKAGEREKYRVRIEYDKDAENVLDEAQIRIETRVPYEQTNKDAIDRDTEKYTITFNPNGGSVDPTTKKVVKELKIGVLPVPTRDGYTFDGWYTDRESGTKITEDTVPTENDTYYAHWREKVSYTITFNANGGSVDPTSKIIESGNAIGELPIPIREDYTFIGWYTEREGGTQITAETLPTGNDTYYAHWNTTEKYTITFNPKGGTANPLSKEITAGQKIGELPTATRDNYIFDGWFTEDEAGEKITLNTIPVGNTVYYAHWISTIDNIEISPSEVSVGVGEEFTLEISGPTPMEDYTITSNDETIVTVDQNGVITGEKEGNTTITIEGSVSHHTKVVNVVVTKVVYVVTFNPKGGQVNPATKELNPGDRVGELPVPTRENYSFEGWYTDTSFTEKITEEKIPESSVTYYAKWSDNSFVELPEGRTKDNLQVGDEICVHGDTTECFNFVKYDENDDLVLLAKYNLKVGIINDSSTLQKIGVYKPTDSGYGLQSSEVKGWVEGEPTYKGGVEFSYSDYWWNTEDTSKPMPKYGDSYPAEVYDPKYDTLPDYDNDGFATSEYSIAAFVIPYKTVINNYGLAVKNIRLLTYDEITSEGMGCERGESNINCSPTTFINNTAFWLSTASGSYVRLYYPPTLYSYGYSGDGGNCAGVRPVIVVTKEAIADVRVENYTITFDKNIGTGETSTKKVRQGNSLGDLPTPVRAKYVFDGWYTGITDGVRVTSETVPDEDVTYYAHWSINPIPQYTVTFNPNTGTVDETTRDIEQGSSIGELPIPTKDGYIFKGWYTDLQTGYRIDETYTPTEDVELFAKWSDFPYVFRQDGACTFGGSSGTITGEDCSNYVGRKYIDTGINLYNSENHDKDYEIGFTIESYNYSDNVSQATLMNTKLEGNSYPGLVFRKLDNTDNLDLSSRNTSSANERITLSYSDNMAVKIYRITNKTTNVQEIFYSINDEEKIKVNDLSQFNPVFNLSVWFGAAPTNVAATSAQRYFNGTLSNMYIKLGTYEEYEKFNVTFNPNGGTVDETSREVYQDQPVGTLPVPEKDGYAFTGWYTKAEGGERITKNTRIQKNITYYAHWKVADIYNITFNPNTGDVDETSRQVMETRKIGQLPRPIKEHYVCIGWYTGLTDGIKIDENYVPTSDMTLYARWAYSEATFKPGREFVLQIKKDIAKDGSTEYYDASEKIKRIEYSQIEPDDSLKIEKNRVSDDLSIVPIYAWFEKTTGTIYWWSEAEKVYMNENASNMFSRFFYLEYIDLSHIDTSRTTNMNDLFEYNVGLTELDISNFNTSNVTNMSGMFDCTDLQELDLSSLDTKKVTNMSRMFAAMHDLESLDLSPLDTSNVTNMSGMFDCTDLQELDLSPLNTSKVTNMSSMFSYTNFEYIDFSVIDTSNVTNMSQMFRGIDNVTLDVSTLDTSNVTNMSGMFMIGYHLRSINFGDNWNTSKVTDMSNMFHSCNYLTSIDLSHFDTSNVIYMDDMFGNCSSLTSLDFSNFNTSKVTDMSGMFGLCTNITTLDLSHFNTSKVTDMAAMFKGCSKLSNIDLSSFDTSQVTDMGEYSSDSIYPDGGMFENCTSLTSLDLSHFNTSKLYDIGGLFAGCSNLVSLNISNWDTSKVYYMGGHSTYRGVFEGCSSLTYLDLSGWDTSKARYMKSMFKDCTRLQVILVGDNWNTSTVTDSTNMFTNATELVGEQGTSYDVNYVDKTYAHVDGGSSNPGYLTRKKDYTVIFNPNNGYVKPVLKELNSGDSIGTLPTPTRTDYVFDGWWTDLSVGIRVDSTYTPNANVTLYAKWKNKYTITFNANGGSVSETSRTVIEGNQIGALPTPTRKWYTFQGWYTDISSGTKIESTYVPTNSRSIFAHWIVDGWLFVNEASSPSLENQQWSYYNNNVRIESGFHVLKDFGGNNRLYYFENGIAKLGWVKDSDDNWFYFSKSDADGNGYTDCGAYVNGVYQIDGTNYTFDENGICLNPFD